MPAPTPKSDQLRALREARFRLDIPARRQGKTEKLNRAVAEIEAQGGHVAKASLATATVDKKEYNRAAQEKWRKANPELHRERARNSMRKLRGKAT